MTTTTEIRTDEEVQKDVLAEFKWDARLSPNEIGVAVNEGVGESVRTEGQNRRGAGSQCENRRRADYSPD